MLLEQRLQPNLTPEIGYWAQAVIDWERKWHDEHKNILWGVTMGRGYVTPHNYYNPDGTLKSVAEWTRNVY